MLFFLPFLLCAPLLSLAAPMPATVHALKRRYYPWNPLRWSIAPGEIKADTTYDLRWQGGSGQGYEVYFIPQWPGQEDYKAVDIASTGSTSVKWHTPKLDEYPQNTTFIVAVNDLTEGTGAVWYDVTGMLPFVAPK